MKLAKYTPDGRDIVRIAGSQQTAAGRAIFSAVEHKRDEVRAKTERNPKLSDDIKEDIRFLLGMVYMCNWILDLPREAQRVQEKGDNENV